MNFLDKMQRKYGKFAIPNLMLYIMLGQTIVLFYSLLLNSSLLNLLYFNPILIMRGQIWRLFTFVFIPNTTSPIFFLFAAFLYYSIGSALEHAWGTFKFNVYYLLGMIFNMLGLLIVQLIFYRDTVSASYFYVSMYANITIYLNLSLFLAYAVLYPEVQFLLYGILPIKVKYLAAIDVIFLAYGLISGTVGDRVLVIVSLLNFLLFFGSKLLRSRPTTTQKQFKVQQRELKQGPPIKVAFHKCSVCGKTELTDPDMEFRYCSKCNGNYEYCMDHLHNHTHIE
ncbi:MAG: rhomboid family intramembrane serine protease [Candidatus Cellulosilyticum pullistercoris]|uniref:Rhomboid family intramembrane serine protease n=1 Tax=Candidatus Cellulosilyticum pullistercoris TaxID=2838521 RepID=A0A9E2KBM5_9FIRM|nr:rhomboid family intramembrane serine protease [Candidatus Cellulosilyticum pullistercoris]